MSWDLQQLLAEEGAGAVSLDAVGGRQALARGRPAGSDCSRRAAKAGRQWLQMAGSQRISITADAERRRLPGRRAAACACAAGGAEVTVAASRGRAGATSESRQQGAGARGAVGSDDRTLIPCR